MKTQKSDERPIALQEGTLLWKKPDYLVAICASGFLYWCPWNGKGHFTSVPEGARVNVHFYEGFENEIVCLEELAA